MLPDFVCFCGIIRYEKGVKYFSVLKFYFSIINYLICIVLLNKNAKVILCLYRINAVLCIVWFRLVQS